MKRIPNLLNAAPRPGPSSGRFAREKNASTGVAARSSSGWIVRWAMVLIFASLGVAHPGCARFRLPAIDPSGERIFLPSPASTSLASCAPKPAFVAPPKPAPCPASELGATAPVAAAPRPACADPQSAKGPLTPALPAGNCQLKLVPAKVVAPVGTDVVLLAGYCGSDGRFIMRQPVEWMMAPDSVGMIVEVGDVGADSVQRWFQETPRKMTGDFAVGYTSHESQVITRGTPSPSDDVRVAKGQTWISVTSPTEGTSHVTCWAPQAKGWDRRKQTATIHWLDAKWDFPAPVVARAGESALISTTVARATDASPHSAWLVRYTIEGLDTRFANNDTQIEVPTDGEGKATAELLPPASGGGTARVNIEVIRPANGNSPRMSVGTGSTTVTWAAPGLSVQVLGPESLALNAAGVFRIVVTNQGELPTRDVVVSDAPPPSLKYVSSNPAGQWFGDHLEWRLGDLPPRSQRVLDATYQAIRPGDIRFCARARSADGLTAENCLDRARIFAPALLLTMTGPQSVPVGGEAQFRIELTNQAAVALTNVRLVDRFDEGLAHTQGERSPLQWNIGTLSPGETKRVALTFFARLPGRLCHVVDAVADGGYSASAQGCVVATAPAPGVVPPGGAGPLGAGPLRLQLAGATRQQAGQSVDYTITVYNASAAALSNVRVIYQHGPSLKPDEATAGFQASRGQLIWDLPQLARDERRSYVVRVSCLQPDPAALNRVTVAADQAAPQTAELSTEITPGPVSPASPATPSAPAAPAFPNAPTGPPSNSNIPRGDNITPPSDTRPTDGLPAESPPAAQPGAINTLSLNVAELADPVSVGQTITYIIRIQNDRDIPDQNVALSLEFPPGIDFTKAKITGFRPRGLGPDARTVEMEPVAELRPREALRPCRVELPATQAGKLQFRVFLRSALQPNPISVIEETTVTAP
jgi:uncharacterized repeat protein (TIGR01451 family)